MEHAGWRELRVGEGGFEIKIITLEIMGQSCIYGAWSKEFE